MSIQECTTACTEPRENKKMLVQVEPMASDINTLLATV